ncbi:hypothetical protein ES703_109234 [subsurface metagenome]
MACSEKRHEAAAGISIPENPFGGFSGRGSDDYSLGGLGLFCHDVHQDHVFRYADHEPDLIGWRTWRYFFDASGLFRDCGLLCGYFTDPIWSAISHSTIGGHHCSRFCRGLVRIAGHPGARCLLLDADSGARTACLGTGQPVGLGHQRGFRYYRDLRPGYLWNFHGDIKDGLLFLPAYRVCRRCILSHSPEEVAVWFNATWYSRQ